MTACHLVKYRRTLGFCIAIGLHLVLSPAKLMAIDPRPDLPRAVPIALAYSPGNVLKLAAGDDLQKALDEAAPGDVISLPAGATFTGPFELPAKLAPVDRTASRWITVQTGSARPPLPAAGIRVSPSNAPSMAKLTSSNGAILRTLPGASHYQFIGIEFTPAFSTRGMLLTELVRLDGHHYGHTDAGGINNTSNFIFARCYFRGDAIVGTRRGIVLNAGATSIVDSYFSDFKIRGQDSQAIVGWDGSGPYLIQNNYLEAAGENIMFGGADPSMEDRVPADISILGNHLAKPLSWRRSGSWTIKNLLELKNARRVLIKGNLLEHNWPESQNGFAILFTVRNQQGTAPWSTVEDVTFTHNIVRRVGSGINILGHDDNHPSRQTRGILVANNLFSEIGGHWGAGHLLQVLDGAKDIHFVHNTVLSDGHLLIAEGRPSTGLIFSHNIVKHSGYGIVGRNKAPGRSALNHYFPDYHMAENIIIGGSRRLYPEGNHFVKGSENAGFKYHQNGDYRLSPAQPRSTGVNLPELCRHLSTTETPPYCSH